VTNLSIAQAATLRDIREIAASAELEEGDFEPLGRAKGKLTYAGIERLRARTPGKLVLVSAITPTPAGEGKTTTSVGLAQGLNRIARTAIPAIREPALGPVLGNKGGACGGGYSQVLPMEEINLFFNGDFPAISAAHNLLSAALDAHLQHGNALDLDPRQPMWPRTVDMGDRALREIIVGLGGTANGYVREDGFVITPASEIMAILCLSRSLAELKRRVGDIIVGSTRARRPVRARELAVDGAMAALLRDALRPNLVQTIEGGPALVHGGPFGNIAHGCSSILGTECALGMAEFTVTEAGFASDLGAEKFLNIVCPQLGRGPDAIVLVATIRALRHHGGGDLETGLANLDRHLAHLRQYGPPVVVAINRFKHDTDEDHAVVRNHCARQGAEAVVADPWGAGGDGCADLATVVARHASTPSSFSPLYDSEATAEEKMDTIVRRVYGGEGVDLSEAASKRLTWARKHGFGELPICMAKTQMSLTADPARINAPTGFRVAVREVRPSAGAGFLVAIAGDIMLMPGLGKEPACHRIDVDEEGRISGMF
jgi:formate--tetrahydrofolate ligase